MPHIKSILASLNKQKFQQAQTFLSTKLISNPSDLFLKLLLGVCLVEQQEKDGWNYVKEAFTHHLLSYNVNGDYFSHFVFYLQNMFFINQQYIQQAKTFQKVLQADSSNISAYFQLYSTYTLNAALETSSKTLSSITQWIDFQQVIETYHYILPPNHVKYWRNFCFWMQMLRSRDKSQIHNFIQDYKNQESTKTTYENSIEFLRLQFTILFTFSEDPIILKEFLEQANIQKFKPTISDSILDNTIFLIHFKCCNFNQIAKTFLNKHPTTSLTNQDFQRFLYLFYYLLLNPSLSCETLNMCFSALHQWWLSSSRSFFQDNALLNIFCFFLLNDQKIRSNIVQCVPHNEGICNILLSQEEGKKFLLKYLQKWREDRLLFSFLRPLLSLFSQDTLYELYDDLIHLYQNSVAVNYTHKNYLLTLQRCLTAIAQPNRKQLTFTCDIVFYSLYKDIQSDPTKCQDIIERFLMIIHKILLYQTEENISYFQLLLKLTHHILPKNNLTDFRFQYILFLLYSYYGFPKEALKLWKSLHIKCLQNISLGWIVSPQLFRHLDITAAHRFSESIMSSKHKLNDSIWDMSLNYVFENMNGNYLAHTMEFKKKLNESQIIHFIVIQHMFSSFLIKHTSGFPTFTKSLQKAMYGVIEPKLDEPHERYLAMINTDIGYEFIHQFNINKPQLFHDLSIQTSPISSDPLFDMNTYINSFTLIPFLHQPNSQLAFLNNSEILQNKPFLPSLAYPNPFVSIKPSSAISSHNSNAGLYMILQSLISTYENDANMMVLVLFLSTALIEGKHEWLDFAFNSKNIALILTKQNEKMGEESLEISMYQEFLSLTAKLFKAYENNRADSNTYVDTLPILEEILALHKAILNRAFIFPLMDSTLTKANFLQKRYNGFMFLILFKALTAYLISSKPFANKTLSHFFLKECLNNLNDAYGRIETTDIKLLDVFLPETVEAIKSEFFNLPTLHEENFPLTPFESFKETTLQYLKDTIKMYQSAKA